MSGHNKWSKIKHKKAATDAEKSRVFGKLARLIASESKRAGADTAAPGLRAAIEKARAANMPSDNIARAIAKGAADEGAALEALRYEAYGPGGAAIIIEGLTDNKNRTAAEIKHALAKHNSALAAPGAAAWAFSNTDAGLTPNTTVALSDSDRAALQALVEALLALDDVQEVFTNAA